MADRENYFYELYVPRRDPDPNTGSPNVKSGGKRAPYRGSNPGPAVYRYDALSTELSGRHCHFSVTLITQKAQPNILRVKILAFGGLTCRRKPTNSETLSTGEHYPVTFQCGIGTREPAVISKRHINYLQPNCCWCYLTEVCFSLGKPYSFMQNNTIERMLIVMAAKAINASELPSKGHYRTENRRFTSHLNDSFECRYALNHVKHKLTPRVFTRLTSSVKWL